MVLGLGIVRILKMFLGIHRENVLMFEREKSLTNSVKLMRDCPKS